jgi:hypothetical protein
MSEAGLVPYNENRRMVSVYFKGYDVILNNFEVSLDDNIVSTFLPERAFRYLGRDSSFGKVMVLPNTLGEVASYHSNNTYILEDESTLELDDDFAINGKYTIFASPDEKKTEMQSFDFHRGLLYFNFLYNTYEIPFTTIADLGNKEMVLVGPDKVEVLLDKKAFVND